MCARYVSPEQRALEAWLSYISRSPFDGIDFHETRYNVAPTDRVPMLIAEDGERVLMGARWGLIPHWWSKDKLPNLTFNARSEEASQKPMWRGSLKTHRCLMPALGWYEWCEAEKVKNESGKTVNQPYYHHCPDEPIIAFAGLWSTWTPPERDPIVTCALLSRSAVPSIENIHHRMPVVLPPELYDEWLNPETSATDVHRMMSEVRQDVTGYRVSTKVNSVRNKSAEVMEPI